MENEKGRYYIEETIKGKDFVNSEELEDLKQVKIRFNSILTYSINNKRAFRDKTIRAMYYNEEINRLIILYEVVFTDIGEINYSLSNLID